MNDRVQVLLDSIDANEVSADSVEIEGHDPVLPSRFPIGESAAIALAAGAAVVARIWLEKTDTEQGIRVRVPRAATSLISYKLSQRNGSRVYLGPTGRSDTSSRALVALYKCRDGRWIHLNGALPHFANLTLSVLGCEANPEALSASIARWNADELEEALAEAGTCGVIVRTGEEWLAHPQGQATQPLGAVRIDKIGESEAEPVGDRSRPLGGIRALELVRMLAGPTTGSIFASHGADVLLANSPELPNPDGLVMDTSQGKLSTWLDLNDRAQAARLLELATEADVFTESYRTGTLDRRGLGPLELVAKRPGLIYVSINCYGDAGPWKGRPGFEQMSQSATGLAAPQRESDDPVLIRAAVCDYQTGYLAALGAMIALWRRSHEGGSYHVRASLCQTGTWIESFGPCCDPSEASGYDDVNSWMVVADTAFGSVRHLIPAVEMTETQPYWSRPTVPLGFDPPEWPRH